MSRRCQLMFVSSAGGHLTQMLRLQGDYDGKSSIVVTERTPSTERLSGELESAVIFLPHGGREKIFLFFGKFAWNIVVSLFRVILYRPKIVISTGAHTAVPTCIFAKLLGGKVIYIESFARIRTATLTGRILYIFSDRFYVQWPELKRFYKRALYKGKLY
jgi:beta-1,4-N-acetylglucosaminyltransferase